MFGRSFQYLFLGFSIGVIFTLWLLPHGQVEITTETITTTSVVSSFSGTAQSKINSSTRFTIDYGNIAQFYEEFYRYYELNKEW
jgi:hypothetical protein